LIIFKRMRQAIVLLLKRDQKIEQIRKKNIPNYKKFKPHITLVYPFEVENQRELHVHIETSIKKIRPFRLSLCSLKKSINGDYLYLLVNKGRHEVLGLHKQLDSGILKGLKNKDMSRYIPHLSLGVFKTNSEIKQAIREIKKENLCFETKINSIQLLTFDRIGAIKSIKNFKLDQ
jgi:2'-5' RNA ligase